ncbi:HAD-IB family phosphatase [Erysipelothrix urinaevulpis]|uniref:HAD-IB family phosphatase n=1 Tax=Erysipelothrix urinaevulpis TaxID=2683717 RepID=UPI001356E92E|nr:HAD-IB family phosphatase [Erysipelothrix urinaevulpis]
MNVYDFDKTIYDGDSSIDFYKYTLKKHPSIIKKWPSQISAATNYKRKKMSKTDMKTIFYRYFEHIPNMNDHVESFWKAHRHNLKDWYFEQKRSDDLIISASPEFLLKPICSELGVDLIASVVDPFTGRNMRENCYGAEKVVRMKEHYNIDEMEQFYSDSYSDDPLAQYASESFLVKGNKLLPW